MEVPPKLSAESDIDMMIESFDVDSEEEEEAAPMSPADSNPATPTEHISEDIDVSEELIILSFTESMETEEPEP
jgi:hypothetical protein